MKKHDSDDLKALFERFISVEEAKKATEDIQQADRRLEAYPAPKPSPEVLNRIRIQMIAELSRKHRRSRIYRFVAAAAAVIIIGIIGIFGQAPQENAPSINQASLLPTAIWESDDIASDDAELAYFQSEISRIETRIEALKSGEEYTAESSTLDELEIELRMLETQFWKE